MARLLARLIAAQDGWARPLGDLNHRWLSAAFRPLRPIKDLLNGTWLGHPLHPAVTDVPIGALLVAVVLDLAAQPDAAFWALLIGQLTFLASVLTGLADYTYAEMELIEDRGRYLSPEVGQRLAPHVHIPKLVVPRQRMPERVRAG